MKKLLSMIVTLTLVLSFACSALATEAVYPLTKSFLSQMDAMDVSYTVIGVDEDGDECVSILNVGDAGNKYEIVIYFREDSEAVLFYVWDLISFSEESFADVLNAVNKFNADWLYAKAYVEDDNTVTVSLSSKIEESTSADLVLDMLMSLVDRVDSAYEYVAPYAL